MEELCIDCGHYIDKQVEQPFYVDNYGPLCEECYDECMEEDFDSLCDE